MKSIIIKPATARFGPSPNTSIPHAMAERLIENLTEPFDPTRYRDEYREALEALIQAKIAGEEVAPAPEQEEDTGRERQGDDDLTLREQGEPDEHIC